MIQPIQFSLTQKDIPTHWYNVLPDFPEPLPPPLHPGTKQPLSPEDMLAIFPENLVAQEMPGDQHGLSENWRGGFFAICPRICRQ